MRVPSALICIAIFTSLLLCPDPAPAQAVVQYPLSQTGSWEFGIWGGEAVGTTIGQPFGTTLITMVGLQAGRVIHESSNPDSKRTLEYTFGVQPLFLVTQPQRVYGGGFSPVGLKWNFRPTGRYRFYLEGNGGGMFTQKNVPPGRTSTFNFTASGGPGVMIYTRHNQALSISLRFWHLSNANLGHANPAFNTILVTVGYQWMKAGRQSRKVAAQKSATGSATAATATAK